MKNRGYHLKGDNGAHCDEWKKPVYNFEMHLNLFTPNQDASGYFTNVKDRLIRISPDGYAYRFTDEDFYIYITAHACKHLHIGSTGFRTLIDFYIFLKAKEKSLKWTYIEGELQRIEVYENISIAESEKLLRQTAKHYFADQIALTKEEKKLILSMINSGTYGNFGNWINRTSDILNANSKAGYLFRTLMQFQSEAVSMGNAPMNPEVHIVVDPDGTASLEIDLHSLTYLGQDGYLGWMKKVTEIISENKYHYPIEIETEDVAVIEEYVDVYDIFNDPDSDYLDANVEGKWYPKKLSVPIDFENRKDDILVQVYVPVMESIMEGDGTKFVVLGIDWDSLSETEKETLSGDVNGDEAFSVSDVILLQKWLLAVLNTHLENWKAADFDEDDTLNVFDLCLMKRALLHKNNIE